jgi:hypothetical protein
MSIELRISSSPCFKSFLSSCTPMCVWVYSRGLPFPLSRLVDSTILRIEHFWMPGRISLAEKVGNINLYSSF